MRDAKDLHLAKMKIAVDARVTTLSKQVLEGRIRQAHLEDALIAEKKLQAALEAPNG